jgi:hypothetical protein
LQSIIRNLGSKKKYFEEAIDKRTQDIKADYIAQTDALIRFFFKDDPSKMNDSKYIEVSSQMWWVLEATGNIEKKNGIKNFVR